MILKEIKNIKINLKTYKKKLLENNTVYYLDDYFDFKKYEDSIVNHSKLKKNLANFQNPFSLINENSEFITAISDQNRTYPLFFLKRGNEITISENPRNIINNSSEDFFFNNDSLNQAYHSGYVMGFETLIKDIYQIPAGFYLIWNKSKQTVELINYYSFSFKPDLNFDIEKSFKELDKLIDRAIKKTIVKAQEKTILIPLSGGLDSRLVLGKLHQHNYKKIKTFSYGLKDNTEAVTASKIANKLCVDWSYVESKRKTFKKIYNSKITDSYSKFSDFLSVVPNIQEIYTFFQMIESKQISKNIFIVNGQSGDFITGGHIDPLIINKSNKIEDVARYIKKKHFSLWKSSDKILTKLIEQNINEFNHISNSNNFLKENELISILLTWEHRERQSKYVINQQRTYDYFSYDWGLPLWDIELINFWRTIPLDLLINQKFYKMYLHKWNYKNIYSDFPDNVTAWSKRNHIILQPLSSLLYKILPKRFNYFLNNFFAYFSRFGHLYAYINLSDLLLNAYKARNHISFFCRNWLLKIGFKIQFLNHKEKKFKINKDQ